MVEMFDDNATNGYNSLINKRRTHVIYIIYNRKKYTNNKYLLIKYIYIN